MQRMGLGRVELPTSRLSGVRSNHLSYRPLAERRNLIPPYDNLNWRCGLHFRSNTQQPALFAYIASDPAREASDHYFRDDTWEHLISSW